jgi:alkylation response protein AidB-like acyl-CoA dehydrogenase
VAARFFSERNLAFLLHEVFDAEALTGYGYYRAHHRKTFDRVIKAASKLAKNLLYPVFMEMDRKPPEWVDGKVKVHPMVPKILKEFGNGGWITSRVPFDRDGEQLPHLIADACDFIFQAANYSAHVYPVLTTGAANLIESFGGPDLSAAYVPDMYAGKWQGTMALTEPEAGSSLSDIATTAEPTDRGHYLIKGQKIFISAGDHDGAENVVHLLLAKIKGSPAGIRGISLFVVPKKRKDTDGKLMPNDVSTSGIYHKLGYRGCPIVQLSLGDADDCRGWLVGEPHRGLRYMFQMMNEFRIGVGLGATAMGTAAYYAALDYARERRQGRKPSQKDPTLPPAPIIAHADIKRMLLFQRAVIEGSLSLLMQCSQYVDLVKAGESEEKHRLLLEILTPVAKSYPSEMAIHAISQGLQIFGGSGYCDDYPLEQYYRDARIHPIHEGTTGIQAMDLLGRKVVMQDGKALECFVDEVKTTISAAEVYSELQAFAQRLALTLASLNIVTRHLMTVFREKGAEYYLADATLFLEFFGITAIGWQWLLQGIAVQKAMKKGYPPADDHFYRGKMFALRYFFRYEIPKTQALAQSLMDPDILTVDMKSELFN